MRKIHRNKFYKLSEVFYYHGSCLLYAYHKNVNNLSQEQIEEDKKAFLEAEDIANKKCALCSAVLTSAPDYKVLKVRIK